MIKRTVLQQLVPQYREVLPYTTNCQVCKYVMWLLNYAEEVQQVLERQLNKSSGKIFGGAMHTLCSQVHGDRYRRHGTGNSTATSPVSKKMNTLLKMPRTIEFILTKLEAGLFVMNLGRGYRDRCNSSPHM